MSILKTAWKLSFEISPIVLVNGLAAGIPGSMLPIVALTEAVNFVAGLLGGSDVTNLDNFFAHFKPAPGASLINNDVGVYPFANQATAANAIIAQPLDVSLLMVCPAKGEFGYPAKLATMMALRETLAQHNNLGGTYIVATPSYIYTNCILKNMRHVSDQESNQTQVTWQLDFFKPLLTESQAQAAQNSLLSKISNGTPVNNAADGSIQWSGPSQTVGYQPSLATAEVSPAAASTAAAGVPAASLNGPQ